MEWQSLRIVGLADAGIRPAREAGRFSVTFELSERPSKDWRAVWDRKFRGSEALLKMGAASQGAIVGVSLGQDGTVGVVIGRGADLAVVLHEVRQAVLEINLELAAAAHAAATQAAQEATARDRELARLRDQVSRLQF